MATWIHIDMSPHDCFCSFNLKGDDASFQKLQFSYAATRER